MGKKDNVIFHQHDYKLMMRIVGDLERENRRNEIDDNSGQNSKWEQKVSSEV